MPEDFCMCPGDKCPIKEQCYRFKAKPSHMQTWFSEAPFKNRKCEYFVKLQFGNKSINEYQRKKIT